MPLPIKRLIRSALYGAGYQLTPINAPAAPSLDRFLRMLKRQGFSPKRIIDVGANTGAWTRHAIEHFPDASYILIEPQAELRRHVQDLIDGGYKIEWLSAGAGDKLGVLDFTINRRSDSSSFLPSGQEAESAGLSQIKVEVVTLNDVVRSRHGSPPEMIKIDAEGFDLRVLAGASDLLGVTDIVLLEAGVVAYNFVNTVDAVVRMMSDAGYRLVDITDLNRSPKYDVLWLCELAFLRNGSSLLDGITSYE